MDEVNKTLYIPLYGKAFVSQKGLILHDEKAVEIWQQEAFPLKRKSRSKWLAYNMAMRARVFDDWTEDKLRESPDALVLHIGCGLDSRCRRVHQPYALWYDCDLPDVIAVRRQYYEETDSYHMAALDASSPESVSTLPNRGAAIVVLEGLSMYLTHEQLHGFLRALQEKYPRLHVLMDVYTQFGARASKYKNPVNDVGVTNLYGIDDLPGLLEGLPLQVTKELSFTPAYLVDELKPAERAVFKLLFAGRMYQKIYRLFEVEKKRLPH